MRGLVFEAGASKAGAAKTGTLTVAIGAESLGVAGLLAVIVLIGGAGRSYRILQAIVEALSALLLAAVAARHGVSTWIRRDWLAALVIAIAVALPLLQLIPIPFEVWARLPGRALPADTLRAAGIAPTTMPFTLDSLGTRQAILALLPGIALFAAGRNLPREGRRLVVHVLLALAALGACLGAVQIAIGATPAAPAFASEHLGLGIGFFVNRNHQAAFLLAATCLAASMIRRGNRREIAIACGLILLFGAAVLATTSRTGLALLPFCLLPAAGRLRGQRGLFIAGALALCAGFAWWAWWGGALGRVVARLGGDPDVRWAFWRSTWDAVHTYFPLGSGIGSFKAVYPLFEQRSDLFSFYVNHAHNDFLELLLEGGLPAVLGIGVFAAWYGRLIWRASHRDAAIDIRMLWAMAPLLAFSTIEFPLRTLSLMALFGLFCGMALRPDEKPAPVRRFKMPNLALIGAGAAAALVLIASTFPANETGKLGESEAQALLTRMPTNQHAVIALALAAKQHGQEPRARALALAAAPLGWRDPAAQSALFVLYAQSSHFPESLARADALLRTEQRVSQTFAMMRLGAADPGFATALSGELAARPPWRTPYLTKLDDLALPLDAHAALLRALAARGAAPTPEERGAFIVRAAALGDLDTAAAFWRQGIAAHTNSLLPDPNLRRVDVDAASGNGLFGWHRTGTEGLTIDTSDKGATELTVYPSVSGTLLYQTLLLPPGTYGFSLPFAAENGVPAHGLGWTLICADTRWQRLDAEADKQPDPDRWTATFVVPADCPIQRLALHSNGSGFDNTRIRIAKASLSAL